MSDESEPRPPLFVIRGDATPVEVAALTVVLTGLSAGTATSGPGTRPRPEWSAPRRALRHPHSPGPGAWRASSLPG
ncbi:MAG: acyl-CoA carboxylase subunit epsilon [Nocardioidaceae bacterium]